MRASLSALRAAVAVFKADREVDRLSQYSALLEIARDKATTDEFFLAARRGAAQAGVPSASADGDSSQAPT